MCLAGGIRDGRSQRAHECQESRTDQDDWHAATNNHWVPPECAACECRSSVLPETSLPLAPVNQPYGGLVSSRVKTVRVDVGDLRPEYGEGKRFAAV